MSLSTLVIVWHPRQICPVVAVGALNLQLRRHLVKLAFLPDYIMIFGLVQKRLHILTVYEFSGISECMIHPLWISEQWNCRPSKDPFKVVIKALHLGSVASHFTKYAMPLPFIRTMGCDT
jgi:hypothetical protein